VAMVSFALKTPSQLHVPLAKPKSLMRQSVSDLNQNPKLTSARFTTTFSSRTCPMIGTRRRFVVSSKPLDVSHLSSWVNTQSVHTPLFATVLLTLLTVSMDLTVPWLLVKLWTTKISMANYSTVSQLSRSTSVRRSLPTRLSSTRTPRSDATCM